MYERISVFAAEDVAVGSITCRQPGQNTDLSEVPLWVIDGC
jgi:hypothetical protein